MGVPSVLQVPSDFWPATVLADDGLTIVCLGHEGVPMGLGYELTGDPVEDWNRAERLRLTIWWQLDMIRRGIDPDSEGLA